MNRWFDQLPNWKFAAIVASVTLVVLVVAVYLLQVSAGRGSLSFYIGYAVVFTAATTGGQTFAHARRRKKLGGSSNRPNLDRLSN